jgi:hypothetical protein
MEHQQSSNRLPHEQDQLSALMEACDSNETAPLKNLVDSLHATSDDLKLGIWPAIDHSHPEMVRYLLAQGVDHVDGFIIQRALKASSLQVLELLREYGWDDVNAKVEGVPLTALLCAFSFLSLTEFVK